MDYVINFNTNLTILPQVNVSIEGATINAVGDLRLGRLQSSGQVTYSDPLNYQANGAFSLRFDVIARGVVTAPSGSPVKFLGFSGRAGALGSRGFGGLV